MRGAELLGLQRDLDPERRDRRLDLLAPRAPTTTTVRAAPSAATLSIRWSSIGRPAIGCSTLCRSDFIRVPLPAARMIAAIGLVMLDAPCTRPATNILPIP